MAQVSHFLAAVVAGTQYARSPLKAGTRSQRTVRSPFHDLAKPSISLLGAFLQRAIPVAPAGTS